MNDTASDLIDGANQGGQSARGISHERQNALIYLPIATGSLSLIGSSLIILSIYRSNRGRSSFNPRSSASRRSSLKGQTSHVYNRLMTAMSIYDIVFSLFSSMFGNLFTPQQSGTSDGHGTTLTCTLQGFFTHWGYGCFAYGAWLSVYYMLTIRYNVQDAFLVKYLEPVIHSSVFVVYFGTALVASIQGFMNPTVFSTCYIVPYPLLCAENKTIPCHRGTNYKQAVVWMVIVPSSISVAVILVCLSLVAFTVWQQRGIVRGQNTKLPGTDTTAGHMLPSSLVVQPTAGTAFDARISVAQDCGALSTDSANGPLQSTQSVAAASIQTRASRNKSVGAESISSPFEQHAKDAIVQCIISGCTVANSVIWLNVVMGLLVTGHWSRKDRYWVRSPLSGRFVLSQLTVLCFPPLVIVTDR
jgi:hypothetical protein